MPKLNIKNIPFILLISYILYYFMFCLYITNLTSSNGGDTLEHIHSSWLVYANFIPYKDFFQHHNPLLWYVFSPIVGLHAHNINDNHITSIVLSISILCSFLNYYYLYKITKDFISDNLGSLIASSIAITPYIVLSIIQFRPDNYMLLSFFAGLYYYLCYLKSQKLWQLSLSLILFWISFMFLQKIIFTLVLLGFISLYLMYKGKIKINDMLYSLVLPITLSLAFASYLYYHNILLLWYESNFTFNLEIPKLFPASSTQNGWPELHVLSAGSFLAIVFYWRKSNLYFKILSILFVFEFIQRYFYFAAFAYYYCLLAYFAAIMSAVFIREIMIKKYYFIIYLLLLSLAINMYKPQIFEGNLGERTTRFYRPLTKEILQYLTPCDYVMNGDGTIYNLYNRDPHYYWNLIGQTDVIGARVGIYPLMDINQLIKDYMPKIINVKPYFDKYYSQRGQEVIVHLLNMDIINQYYKPYNNSDDLYILRPEFSNVHCDYDYKKRYYHAY